MTISMTGRLALFLIVILVLSGCSRLGQLKFLPTTEAEAFTRALDEYMDTGDLTSLKRIPKQYPHGEWRQRAEAIIDLAEQLEALQALQKDAGGKLELCEREKKRLAGDNQILNTTLERLKQVLIDTELRND